MSEEKTLLRLLWIRHGCPLAALYGDDGEMQCNACGIDFKRMTAKAIDEAFTKIGMRKLRDAETGIEVMVPAGEGKGG